MNALTFAAYSDYEGPLAKTPPFVLAAETYSLRVATPGNWLACGFVDAVEVDHKVSATQLAETRLARRFFGGELFLLLLRAAKPARHQSSVHGGRPSPSSSEESLTRA